MSVTGTCGGTEWVIEIPMSHFGCADFYWAMSVGADFAGTAGMVHYRFTSATGFWGATPPLYHDTFNCTLVIPEAEGWFLTGAEGVECNYIYLGILEPCETFFVIQSYHLDLTVDNWAQSVNVIYRKNVVLYTKFLRSIRARHLGNNEQYEALLTELANTRLQNGTSWRSMMARSDLKRLKP